MKLKIIFMGTSEFGTIILEGLVKNNLKPCLVITVPDKPVGRKQILSPPPVKLLASKYGIPISQPKEIRNSKFEIRNSKPDLIIVTAYGQIIPKEILDIPKYGFLNVHPSLLPKYRGPSPIQYAILNGDKETGVTIILMDEKIDHGPIVANYKLQIRNYKITYEKLLKELANLGAKLLVETLPKWIKGEIEAKDQDDSKATYTKIIKKEDGKIDWRKSAEEIERQIRAFNPWPGSFTFWKNKRIKILEAEVSRDNKSSTFKPSIKTHQKNIKKVLDKLIIKKLQPEGKRPMTFEEFKRGHPDFNIEKGP